MRQKTRLRKKDVYSKTAFATTFAHVSSVPLAVSSFSALISKLLHTHCAATGSICGTFIDFVSVLILCLRAFAGAVAVLCS